MAGQKLLSNAEIDNIAKEIDRFSVSVDQAVKRSSGMIDGTLSSQLMKSYEISSQKSGQNVAGLRNIVQYLNEYNKIVNGMVAETRNHLLKQKNSVEGNIR
ncbi:MAG: hypothetical protein IKF71_02370 [Bacilli bacterium]|nr:hypothetical protein [Bacilli bacterium]